MLNSFESLTYAGSSQVRGDTLVVIMITIYSSRDDDTRIPKETLV